MFHNKIFLSLNPNSLLSLELIYYFKYLLDFDNILRN